MPTFTTRLKHAWNAFNFTQKSPEVVSRADLGASYSYRPDRPRLRLFNDKTIVTAIYTRLGIDVASVDIKHIRVDTENGQYQEDIDSGINNCLTVEANIDQASRMFIQDIAMTLFDNGVAAIVPVDTTLNPLETGGYDVSTMRVGTVLQWYPRHVKVRVYNDSPEYGNVKQDITLPKNMVAIVENPLFAVMNEPSSTLQRLIRKLALLDAVDEQSASGKLDILIQLPYVVKTETRREEARKRLKEIEFQLKGSQYGIAYVDGTEKVTQLNRPAENNLMAQIQYLTTLLYSQLGLTEEVMNGTANEESKLDYFNRTIEPIVAAIAQAMNRTFLTRTARSQGQRVAYIRNPFRLVTMKDLAELADKLTRNEVLSSNEMRSVIGFRPSKDPKADQLLNKNIPAAYGELPVNGTALQRPQLPPRSPFPQVKAIPGGPGTPQEEQNQNGS